MVDWARWGCWRLLMSMLARPGSSFVRLAQEGDAQGVLRSGRSKWREVAGQFGLETVGRDSGLPLDTGYFEINIDDRSCLRVVIRHRIDRVLRAMLGCFRPGPCVLNVSFVDEREMEDLNRRYRGKASSTDVLSFPQIKWKQPLCFKSLRDFRSFCAGGQAHPGVPLSLGDIVISVQDATLNANRIGQGVDRELCFLLVHGLFHLLGHDHMSPEDEDLMVKEQRKMMDFLEASGVPLWHGLVSEAPSGQC